MKKEKDKEKAEEEKSGEDSGGAAESVLDSMGDLIPGLGGLIKGLKKFDLVKERFASIDEEVEQRVKGTQLKTASIKITGGWSGHRSRPPCGIPPSVARRRARPRKHFDTFTAGDIPMDKGERDVPVDIFEEENELCVITELPGVNEEDIVLDLNENILIISASRGKRSYHKKVKLPRTSESIVRKIYNNGILEVTLS